MQDKSSDDNWDHLSDADWFKKLDERIAFFNEGRGEVECALPPHAIMDNEYIRGINNKLVTEDLIRHFADAIGDPNPFWRDPTYANGTRWGGFIAPPIYESCIAYGSAFGGRMRVPGVDRLAAGNLHEYFMPIRPGDTFSVHDKYGGFEEKKVKDKPYRMFIEKVPRYYVNQRNEVAAIATGRNIYLATPPSKRAATEKKAYKKTKIRHHFSKEELDVIHQGYEDQLVGKNRRGAKVRYWEDVKEGEELPTVIKGPYDITDACARTTVSCYSYAFAIKWAAMRKHLQHHPIDPETGEYKMRRDWHYEDVAARLHDAPLANVPGIHSEMMLVHIVTDWMGDDAFVRSIDSQDRRMVYLGDATFVKGRVKRKFTDDKGERLVELDVWGEDQDGQIHTKSAYVVKLVSKQD